MKRLLPLLLTVIALTTKAERRPDFVVKAFDSMAPQGIVADYVLSPLAFEVDCVVFSETFDTLTRADYMDKCGTLTGNATIFAPLIEFYGEQKVESGFALRSARAFLTSRLADVDINFRLMIGQTYGVEVCSVKSGAKGVDAWFRAKMDGDAEDFSVPKECIGNDKISFYDLESFNCRWLNAFNVYPDDPGMMHDTRRVQRWETPDFTLIKLPMVGEHWFYALVPRHHDEINRFAKVLAQFSPENIEFLLTVTGSITERGVRDDALKLALPIMDIVSESNLEKGFIAHKLELPEFRVFGAARSRQKMVQKTRFRLDNSGLKAPFSMRDDGVGELRLDGDFIFFVFHEPTRSMPIAGIRKGEKLCVKE